MAAPPPSETLFVMLGEDLFAGLVLVGMSLREGDEVSW